MYNFYHDTGLLSMHRSPTGSPTASPRRPTSDFSTAWPRLRWLTIEKFHCIPESLFCIPVTLFYLTEWNGLDGVPAGEREGRLGGGDESLPRREMRVPDQEERWDAVWVGYIHEYYWLLYNRHTHRLVIFLFSYVIWYNCSNSKQCHNLSQLVGVIC